MDVVNRFASERDSHISLISCGTCNQLIPLLGSNAINDILTARFVMDDFNKCSVCKNKSGPFVETDYLFTM